MDSARPAKSFSEVSIHSNAPFPRWRDGVVSFGGPCLYVRVFCIIDYNRFWSRYGIRIYEWNDWTCYPVWIHAGGDTDCVDHPVFPCTGSMGGIPRAQRG